MRHFLPAIAAGLALMVSTAQAATVLFYTGSPESWVSQGQTETITPETGYGFDFRVRRNWDNGISFQIDNFSNAPEDDYTASGLDFAAPEDVPITAGLFTNAVRWGFQDADQPGLEFATGSRGHNWLTGWFEVFEAAYSASGDVLSFAADFKQFGQRPGGWDWGSIRFNSLFPVTTKPSECRY